MIMGNSYIGRIDTTILLIFLHESHQLLLYFTPLGTTMFFDLFTMGCSALVMSDQLEM